MKKKKLEWIAIAVAVMASLGFWLATKAAPKHAVRLNTEEAALGNISESITATGTIEPVTEVEVGTQVSGIIDKIYVDYNDIVKKGQLIAEMDRITLQAEVASQKAAYHGAEAEFQYQKKNYDRNQLLYQKKLISETDYELSVYNYEKAQSSYESAQAALARAERNLAYATITSPIDGVVISKDVEEGQTVASGFETPTLFTLAADLTQMQVVADVDEADIGGVQEGQRVSFTVDAYPNDVFEGKVTQIRLGSTSNSSSTATSSTTVVTYEVVISAPNPDLKLKPRLTANVSIYTLDKMNVLRIPSKALHFTPEKMLVGNSMLIHDCAEETKVWTLQGNTLTAHPVKTGISNGVYTEILSGIQAGSEVVTEFSTSAPLHETDFPSAENVNNTERSPFMPGPPGKNNNKRK